MTEQERTEALTQVVTAGCAYCTWEMAATVLETREAFSLHRATCPIPFTFEVEPAPYASPDALPPSARVEAALIAPRTPVAVIYA